MHRPVPGLPGGCKKYDSVLKLHCHFRTLPEMMTNREKIALGIDTTIYAKSPISVGVSRL